MREIKFRAWDKKNKKMEYVWGIDFAGNPPIANEATVGELLLGVDTQCFLMQFTGLKDKNDKEIYEGDIIEFDYQRKRRKAEIKYSGTGFWLVGWLNILDKGHRNFKIIGNVHNNPELLEEKE